ncbi:potassium channel family protein [Naumannella halotolerans]|uniref:Trk system potassium uptake protein TrkA n=1 Tax=Naumannella halotolerans TaxID=993414 RepID=A0A4R7J8U8_9ACTN|nr:TrkA family potassium uptake protein [Naumannella halotolerans]TDT33236.1 trk system potassium uptake protein TrkA [Naumannella halotolerans]
MKVIIAGAGNVGRSIATELIEHGHQVVLLEKDPKAFKTDTVPKATWLLADACEVSSLEAAGLEECDVSIAATGDDKANLVHSLLAKTEFSVPRTVGRVNHPKNEWLFSDSWGVDVAVSTPRMLSALVEEAVSVGDLVRLFTFRQSNTDLVEMTLPGDSPCVGRRIGDLRWPADAVLVAVIRDARAMAPEADGALEGGDELLFVTPPEGERELAAMLAPKQAASGAAEPAGDD